LLTVLAVIISEFQPCFGENDIVLMEDYDPEKGQGWWFVSKRTTLLFDDIKCVKFELHHDDATSDYFKMVSWWINSKAEYEETVFDVVDDRDHRARFFFASQRDKIAIQILGTDYNNWLIAHGKVGPKEAYGLMSRTKVLSDQHWDAIKKVMDRNQITKEFLVVEHTDCPDKH